jgi:hypothetical protein
MGLVLILAACTTAPSPSASASGTASPAAGRCGADAVADGGIRGTVVDTDGTPLGDIFITIETGDGFRGTTRTGTDGAFSASGVSGDFTIITLDVDYESLTQRVSVPCGEMVDVELVLTPADG